MGLEDGRRERKRGVMFSITLVLDVYCRMYKSVLKRKMWTL